MVIARRMGTHTRWFVTFALGAMLSGCATPPSAPSTPIAAPPTASTVPAIGRVIDVAANAGVAGIPLEWSQTIGGPVVARTVSDSGGAYFVSLPSAGRYIVGTGSVQVAGPLFTSDFYVNSLCPLRYGVVADAVTGRRVSGATVTWNGSQTLTQTDGAYALNLGCRSNYGTGTTALGVSHPAYLGAGVFDTRAEFLVLGGQRREDFLLTPR